MNLPDFNFTAKLQFMSQKAKSIDATPFANSFASFRMDYLLLVKSNRTLISFFCLASVAIKQCSLPE